MHATSGFKIKVVQKREMTETAEMITSIKTRNNARDRTARTHTLTHREREREGGEREGEREKEGERDRDRETERERQRERETNGTNLETHRLPCGAAQNLANIESDVLR